MNLFDLRFILAFLPICVTAFYLWQYAAGPRNAHIIILVFSIVFYGIADARSLPLLLLSVLLNYICARQIELRDRNATPLVVGILANLTFLGWFKYLGFFAQVGSTLTGYHWSVQTIILPLGISFFTLQQISFLIDVSRRRAKTSGILDHAAFVVFFPILVAGPIVRHEEIERQLLGGARSKLPAPNILIGFIIFIIGLFKKTVIADPIATFVNPIFIDAASGGNLTFAQAWVAAAGFTLQVYFDFSGYSDMAIGVARMFGIRLPLNFHSPLRAASIIEYWRRWHMTLQRFIVTYVYQPMVIPVARFAGSKGWTRWPTFLASTVLPTVLAFVIVGLWHGAAFTFVAFGLMHGLFLAVNEGWRMLRRGARRQHAPGTVSIAAYRLLTLTCLAFSNVMFRAADVDTALSIWTSMANVSGIDLGRLSFDLSVAVLVKSPLPIMALAIMLVWLMPNTQQLMRRYNPALDYNRLKADAPPKVNLVVSMSPRWAIIFGLILFLGFSFITRGETQFIYRNF